MTNVFLAYTTTSPGLRTLGETQKLKASWLLKQDIYIASDVDLALLGGNSDNLDLAKNQVGVGTALDKGEIELMELWIENVVGWDEMRASHNDLLSVQKSMEIEGWLALADVQDSADSMAAASSS